ncbi:MAG: GAK system ATP-grasp enzyme [Desulfonauticus sp.]|nr:GAK system ATP-grasp enzyme [Desulfonauticus sp.]
MDKKIGVIGIPKRWSSELLADAIYDLTGFRLLVDLSKVEVDFEAKKVWFEGVDLTELDALIIKKVSPEYSSYILDRLEILCYLESLGVKIFSSPKNIAAMVDRLSCTVKLQQAGIPMPPTTITEDLDIAERAIKKYGQAILKPLYTSKARGMILVSSEDDIRTELEEYKQHHPVFYIQKKIDLNGKDLGVAFLGGKYLATYARCRANNRTWNTTTVNGGKYSTYEPSAEVIELATRAQKPFGLDFTCVDVAETSEGLFVFEVSAFGGFRGLLDGCGLDAAKMYAQYVLERIR